MARYYARHGLAVERGTWPRVFLDGREAPAGTVLVDGQRFFAVQHRPHVVVTYIDLEGVVRRPRLATAIDELREALECDS